MKTNGIRNTFLWSIILLICSRPFSGNTQPGYSSINNTRVSETDLQAGNLFRFTNLKSGVDATVRNHKYGPGKFYCSFKNTDIITSQKNNYPTFVKKPNLKSDVQVKPKSFYSMNSMNPSLKNHPLFYETQAIQSLKPNHSCEAIRIFSPQKSSSMKRIVH